MAMSDETTTPTLRRCIGSARFGIAPHDAPVEGFPKQPSHKDGLGRMCRTHWNAYTAGLARDAKARKAAAEGDTPPATEGAPEPATTSRRPSRPTIAAAEPGAQGDAG